MRHELGPRALLMATLAMTLALSTTAARADEADSADEKPAEIPVTGTACAELTAFDEMFVELLRKNDIPGAALALTHQGRLVYARGFGWADRDEQKAVEPDALFRLASVSKPITALAIMQLAERGKLDLNAKIVDVLDLGSELEATKDADPRWRDVTLRQLLEHTGGWDRDKSFDPMFRVVEIAEKLGTKPPAGPNDVIRYMLGIPLDFDPGARYAYSNFGYCMLGRVIERVTGGGYEEYVKEQVLAPLGVRRMQLGHTLLAGRAENEVAYYDNGATGPAVMGDEIGAKVPQPYGAWHLEAMDAHGAWLGSVVELARIAVALDKPESCPILSASSIATMFSPPAGAPGHEEDGKTKAIYYGCGWQVKPHDGGTFDTWHSGSLPGTSTMLMRRHDGNHWVVLFNTRRTKGKDQPAKLVEGRLHQAIEAVETWPEHNLFEAQ